MSKTKQPVVRPTEPCVRYYWPTSDDWSPNFERNTVRIAVYLMPAVPFTFYRITVCGADDTMMEKDLRIMEPPDRVSMEAKCLELSRWLGQRIPNPITKAWLLEHGFTYQ